MTRFRVGDVAGERAATGGLGRLRGGEKDVVIRPATAPHGSASSIARGGAASRPSPPRAALPPPPLPPPPLPPPPLPPPPLPPQVLAALASSVGRSFVLALRSVRSRRW